MSSGVAAFFDIDKTVLEINSGTKWISYMRRTGQMGVGQLLRALTWLLQYRFGLLDYDAMAAKVLRSYAGKAVEPLAREIEQWFAAEVRWAICTEARARIAQHRERGELVVLLTSATQFLTQPVARELDIEAMLCTQIEVEAGHFTGRYRTPACYGAGKVRYAEQFAAEHGVDLEASWFYSDSYTDLPMLERVGNPVVVNPDPRLRRVALHRRWPIEIWRAPPQNVNGSESDVGLRAG